MASKMIRESIDRTTMVKRAFGLCATTLLLATAASAQTRDPQSPWRIGASTGAYAPMSPLIKAVDTNDTRLSAGPTFALEPQYSVNNRFSIYGSALIAFPTVHVGSAIIPAVLGPSNQVTLGAGTAGLMAAFGNSGLQPTLRVGGGVKFYSFDLTGADSQIRPTIDAGLGIRGLGMGALDGTAEIRFMPSSFDQAKLP